jgi:hypothetical protein
MHPHEEYVEQTCNENVSYIHIVLVQILYYETFRNTSSIATTDAKKRNLMQTY